MNVNDEDPLVPRDGDICATSASELSALLRAGALSSVQIVTAHLDRIQAVNSRVNALVTIDEGGGLGRAEELGGMARAGRFAGPRHGLPLAVKDTCPTVGLRTTYCARLFADHVPRNDAVHVSRLRSAGAIVIGKTNAAEFAYGAQTTNPVFGTCRNPYDLRKTVSGSSGGAAAALAAGLAVLADGSDLGGSIRAPAGFTGVVGMRPTSRIVPLEGSGMPFDGLNVPGPMTRTVKDARLMLQIMAGASPGDPLSQGVSLGGGDAVPEDLAGLRFAWCMTPSGTPIHPDVATALVPARGLLETCGGRVEEADPNIGEMTVAQQIFRDWSARLELGPFGTERRAEFGPELQRTLARADVLTLDKLAAAEQIRKGAWERIRDFFERYDVIVWPTNCQPAYEADADVAELGLDETPVLATPALGLPAVSIPFGTMPDGIPVGLQLIGRRYSDNRLLAVAQFLTHHAEKVLRRNPADGPRS